MNGNLAALCGFATEVTITPSFGGIWADAMRGKFGPLNASVVNAWGFASITTQSKVDEGDDNVARVVCWETTRNDRLFGFGSQGPLPGPGASTLGVIEVDFVVP